LRRFARFLSVCAVAGLASFAHTQQVDVAGGGSEIYSSKNSTASQAYVPPAEKGGVYESFSVVRLFENHFGYSLELATPYKQQLYNGFQGYRPFIYDVNAVYAHHVAKRTTLNIMAGAGGQTTLFYTDYNFCSFPGGCIPRTNSTHLLAHLGAGARYSVWRNFFVRPEANYYFIINNDDFHSRNVIRLGASFGYTFH
jgi:hypothetical protein